MADRIDRVDRWVIEGFDALTGEKYEAAVFALKAVAAALGLYARPGEAEDESTAEVQRKPIWITQRTMQGYAADQGYGENSPMPAHVWRTLRRHPSIGLQYNDEPEASKGVDLHSLIRLVRGIQGQANPETGKFRPGTLERSVGRGFGEGSYLFLLGFVVDQMKTQEAARSSAQSLEE